MCARVCVCICRGGGARVHNNAPLGTSAPYTAPFSAGTMRETGLKTNPLTVCTHIIYDTVYHIPI